MSKSTTDNIDNPNRRKLLGGVVAGALTLPALSKVAKAKTADPEQQDDKIDLTASYPFYGNAGQPGITTSPQRHCVFMTFDVTCKDKAGLQLLLARWSSAIAQLMAGKPVGQVEPSRAHGIGADSGEALGLAPAALTITLGLGPGIFDSRFGLQHYRPSLLRPLPVLPADNLQEELTGGDLSLQACADDPQVAWHAIRVLTRIANALSSASTRWTVMGFGRASAGKDQSTPRNLFGFKDGTRNITDAADFKKHVWIDKGADWQHNGSYQVVRKIRMHIENWDTDRVSDQNQVFGRYKVSGAPLSGQHEFDQPQFDKKNAEGQPLIPINSHISLAAHEHNQGIRILRRSYNYTDGLNNVGLLDAGLLFISYQNDPASFVQIQKKLGASDALNEYISHIGSALFYIPPAAQPGSYLGAWLFGE